MALVASSGRSTVLHHAFRATMALVASGVLVNAVIAGRARIGDWDITVHGVIGNVIFTVAVVGLVLAVVRRTDRLTVAITGLLVVLVVTQVGLGYSGRSSAEAVAWHIPNGVAIFGLAVWAATRAPRPAPAQG